MKKKIMRTVSITVMSLIALATQNAQATVYSVDLNGTLGNSGGGYVTNLSSSYDDSNNTLSFSSTVTEKNNWLANGFWLVINGGGSPGDAGNPKGRVNEIAIFYGDYSSNRLTAYVYNGQNNSNSFQHGTFIQSFTTEFTSTYTNDLSLNNDGVSTFDFNIDLGIINDPAGKPASWRGVRFTDAVGIWYHPFFADNGAITYNQNGSIINFSTRYSGWFDTSGTPTTKVPEPGGMGLLFMGLSGLVLYRRKAKI